MRYPKEYTISQAAKFARCSASTLRRLDERGIFKAERSPAGYRIYSIQDIHRIMNINGNAKYDRRFKVYQEAVDKLMKG